MNERWTPPRRVGEVNPHTGEPEYRSKEWHFLMLPARRERITAGLGCLVFFLLALVLIAQAMINVGRLMR